MFDVKNIPINLRNLLSISALLPFWYISIYIFHPSLYNSKDILLIASVCIGLSLVSSAILGTAFAERDGILHHNAVFPTVLIQMFTLSLLIFICYLVKEWSGSVLTFYGFLIVYFVIIMILFFYKNWLDNQKDKK